MSDPHFSLINFLRQNVLLSYGKTNSDNFNEALAIVELADSSLTLLQAVNFQFPVDSVAEPSFLRQGLMRPSSWAVYSMPIQSRLHLASRQWKTQLSRVVTSLSVTPHRNLPKTIVSSDLSWRLHYKCGQLLTILFSRQ